MPFDTDEGAPLSALRNHVAMRCHSLVFMPEFYCLKIAVTYTLEHSVNYTLSDAIEVVMIEY